MTRILVVGSINMDLMLRMERIPGPGESMIGRDYAYGPGGKGENQAVACARLGAATDFLGRVGKDEHGEKLLANLRACGVSDRLVSVDETLPSGLAIIYLEDAANRITVYPGANMGLMPEHVAGAFDPKPDAMMIQFELNVDTVVAAVSEARKRGVMTVVDAGPARNFPIEKIAGVDVISPNEPEAQCLTGIYPDSEENILGAAKRLMERAKPKMVVMKLGSRGAAVYDGSELRFFPAFKVKAVDTTAAGDAFTAGLTLALAEKKPIEEAVRFASAAGALSVTRHGAAPSLPTREEVETFLAAQK